MAVAAERAPSAVELFDRSVATLVQSWLYLASGSPGAEVIEADGAAIAIFAHSPDREFLNNAVLPRDVVDLDSTLDAVERAYSGRGGEPTPEQFWRLDGLDDFAPNLSAEGAYFYVARLEGEDAAMLMAFDHDGDCGIYMVGTQAAARRRGLATALSVHAIEQARERGCATASLQSTEMAEGVYARVGFHDLGRFHEYTPIQASKEKK